MLQLNNLYLMDCMQGMSTFPDKYFDIAVVDPPYGIGNDGGKIGGDNGTPATNYTKYEWDNEPPPVAYFTELTRVSKNQIIFGANHFIDRIGKPSPCWIVWDKQNTGKFADCELAYTSYKTAVRMFSYRWNGFLQGNMKNKEARFHPTQKPTALYAWIYQNYAKQGDKVLDTHAGSASSLVAAYDLGLDYIGFEINEEYYTAATERIESAKAQIRLDGFMQVEFTSGGVDNYNVRA